MQKFDDALKAKREELELLRATQTDATVLLEIEDELELIQELTHAPKVIASLYAFLNLGPEALLRR